MMHVPKTTADEDDFSQPRENQIGRAGQLAHMQAVAEAHCVDETADDSLGQHDYSLILFVWIQVFARSTTALGILRLVTAHFFEASLSTTDLTDPISIGCVSAFRA